MDARGDSPVEIRVLGPVEVAVDGRPVRLGPRLTDLLCALVLAAGRPVPAARLAELLHPGGPPATAATLRSHVAHLRRALGRAAVATAGPGLYRLGLAMEAVDAQRFADAHAEGRFADALDLWRGPAYAGLGDRPHVRPEAERLEGLRRRAVRGHAATLPPRDAADLLAGVVAEDPYDEEARRDLVLARYAAGRIDAAAEACREGIEVLHARGLDAAWLLDLQQRVLRRSVAAAVPLMLPPAAVTLVGREPEAAEARRRLGPGGAVLVVTGPPGVGKSSLALHVGHALAGRYPDGQLHADLRGFDPAGPATDPADALHGLLDALGVTPDRMPAGVAARAGLYRSLLAGRRMLVVLDDARDATQVRPLLPGAPGCATIVTSRDQLRDLLAADGAHAVTLDVIGPADARALLAARVGERRVADE
ncbi:BTAD domain-containing putative transcriptional regulator, partial [Dactylosporangium sp. NPDC005572]|uniref:AfsR/SARP family transcriptional regulator n=1 Tax=Dactylosporangium sp. NPDC005572 TaxID=3156889 RepID=UPI0033A8258E